jgi:GxxExxY protein
MDQDASYNHEEAAVSYTDARYPLSALTGSVIAAAQEVFHTLGPGFREVIYQRALAKELPVQQLEHSREVWIDVHYKGDLVGRKRVDFVIGDNSGDVMVEIKAKSVLEDVDFVQALSYLKASGYPVGLLINFGGKKLEVRRLVNERNRWKRSTGSAETLNK